MKTTIITMLLVAASMCAVAQERYDFIIAYIDPTKPVIHLIQNDVSEKMIDTGKKVNDYTGQNERLLNTISQLTQEGWEVITISNNTFYLRKKKN